MAFIACCGITCTTQSIFREESHQLLVCRPNLRLNTTTNLGTKLENNFGSSRLLRDQSLASNNHENPQTARCFPKFVHAS
jgi:hypothetical protein